MPRPLLALAFASSLAAQGLPLEWADVPALRPGSSTDLRLDPPARGFAAWSPVPGTFAPAPGDAPALRATIPALPTGRFPVRIAATHGASPWRLVLVDPLPSARDAGDGRAPMAIRVPSAIDGTVQAGGRRVFEVALKRRERVVAEVVARRMGSPLDPRLRITDAAGRELAACDDLPGLEGDAWIEFVAPAAGRYRVEVTDTLGEGGPKHRFRLRVHGGAPEVFPFLPADDAPGAIAYPTNRATLPVPCAVKARFDRAGEPLEYRLVAAARTAVRVTLHARLAGSRADVSARVLAPDGTVEAENDATRGDDGALEATLGPGEHRLVLAELSRGAGPGYGFSFEVAPSVPDVVASLDKELLEPARGGSAELKVTLTRRGHDGEVEVVADGLPAGFRTEGGKIGAKQKDGTLKVTVPSDAAAGAMHRVRFKAVATVAGQRREWPVHTRAALRPSFPDLLCPPPSLDGLVTICPR